MRHLFAIMFALGAVCLAGCGPDPVAVMQPVEFDAVRWKAWADPHSDERFRMVPSLLRDYRLIGLSSAQVLALLGPTPFTENDAGFESYHYWLGHPREEWGTWGYPFLSVKFADDRAVKVFHLAGMGAVADHKPRQE